MGSATTQDKRGQPRYSDLATGGTFPLGRSLRSLKTGIIGLGHVGAAVAKRMQAMGANIAYQGPRRKPSNLDYFATVKELAGWADLLIITCPAVPETIGLIDRQVLDALGPAEISFMLPAMVTALKL